jgi:1-phosphatidylinositol-4-phosphate 5-kinase
MLHFACILIVLGVPTITLLTHNAGLSLTGTCSFKQGAGFPIAGFVLLGVYLMFSVYTILFFRSAIPNTETLLESKNYFIKYYINYVIASSVIWSVLAASYFMMGINCTKVHNAYLNIFTTLDTLAKLATPIVLSILRYYDPTIRSKIMRLFGKITNQRS